MYSPSAGISSVLGPGRAISAVHCDLGTDMDAVCSCGAFSGGISGSRRWDVRWRKPATHPELTGNQKRVFYVEVCLWTTVRRWSKWDNRWRWIRTRTRKKKKNESGRVREGVRERKKEKEKTLGFWEKPIVTGGLGREKSMERVCWRCPSEASL